VDQDQGVVEFDLQLFGVGHEIGREIPAVELHALDGLQLGFEALRFLDRDHALIADLVHGFGEDATDGFVAVGRNRRNLRDLAIGRNLLGMALEVLDHSAHGKIDTALEIHRVHPGGNGLGPFANDRLGKNGCGGRAIAGLVVLLVGDFAQHLRPHVLELVLEFDFLRDGYAVLGDAGRPEAFLDHHVASFGAEGDFDRICKRIHAAEHAITRVRRKLYFLCSHFGLLLSFLPSIELKI
jgi:hypothetical protein